MGSRHIASYRMLIDGALGAAALVAGTLTLAGCATGEAENAPAAPPPPAVTTAEVLVREVRDWADFTGRLEAAESVEVRARVGGYVESVHFDEGGRVAKGDLLFQIDPRPFQAEVDRLTAERERARAALDVARSNAERAERLLAQNATSREESEQLAADAAVAAATLAAVEAALDAAELDLSFTRVTAPIAGRVSRAVVTAGNLVDSSTLLTTVVSDNPIHAYFDVDEHTYLELLGDVAGNAGDGRRGAAEGGYAAADVSVPHGAAGAAAAYGRAGADGSLAVPGVDGPDAAGGADGAQRPAGADDARGTAVYVGLVNEQGYPHVARLDFVDNQVDPDQGTIRARAVLDNPDGKLTPGLFARLRLVGRGSYSAALVAERAIGTDLDRKFVLVVDEQNVAQYRAVETGKVVDELRVVTEGLESGDVVIVNGLQRVRPGMPVTPTQVAMEAESSLLQRFAAADGR